MGDHWAEKRTAGTKAIDIDLLIWDIEIHTGSTKRARNLRWSFRAALDTAEDKELCERGFNEPVSPKAKTEVKEMTGADLTIRYFISQAEVKGQDDRVYNLQVLHAPGSNTETRSARPIHPMPHTLGRSIEAGREDLSACVK